MNWAPSSRRAPRSANTGINPWTTITGYPGQTIAFFRGEWRRMGACTMGSRKLLLPVTILVTSLFAMAGLSDIAKAQSPTYGVGKTPTPEEIHAWDISVSPEGKELPPGHGTAKQGAQVYLIRGC